MMTPQLDPKLFLASKPAVGSMSPNSTAPAPPQSKPGSPLAMPAMSANASPTMPMQQPKAANPNPLAGAFASFARGFAPQQTAAVDERYKADGMERNKKALTWLQQTAQLPAEQRAAFTLSRAQDIARDTGQSYEAVVASARDPNGFSDDSIKQGIAAFSAQLGMAPTSAEPMTEYQRRQIELEEQKAAQGRNQFIQGPDGSLAVGNLNDGTIKELRPGQPKPDPANYDMVTTADGVIAVNKNNPNDRIRVGARPPSQSSGSDGLAFRTLTPEELAQRGYPKGSVVQVDSRGKEYRTASPSTAQTGQPTESERAAGLHAQVSLNGLRQLMAMEGEGYNRAGVAEQLFGSTFGLEKERLYDQSADEFIDGYLRAMTGAAATKQEIETYKKQWFPQWGDTAPVIAQKSAGRLNAIQAMKSKAGRSWNPNWDALLNQMQGGTPSSSPMQLATERGSETVPGMNWNGAQMDYRSPAPADDLSQMSTEDLERMLAEAEGR
jgi:hypothetical protein